MGAGETTKNQCLLISIFYFQYIVNILFFFCYCSDTLDYNYNKKKKVVGIIML